MIDKESFVESLSGNRLKSWRCQEHNVEVSLGSPCPLCKLELLKEKRKQEIAEINLEESKKPQSGLNRKTCIKYKQDYWRTEKQRRREAQIKSNKKKGKEYWKKVSKKRWQKVKVQRIERQSMFSSIL